MHQCMNNQGATPDQFNLQWQDNGTYGIRSLIHAGQTTASPATNRDSDLHQKFKYSDQSRLLLVECICYLSDNKRGQRKEHWSWKGTSSQYLNSQFSGYNRTRQIRIATRRSLAGRRSHRLPSCTVAPSPLTAGGGRLEVAFVSQRLGEFCYFFVCATFLRFLHGSGLWFFYLLLQGSRDQCLSIVSSTVYFTKNNNTSSAPGEVPIRPLASIGGIRLRGTQGLSGSPEANLPVTHESPI